MFHRQPYLQFGIAMAGSAGSAKSIRTYQSDTFIQEDFNPEYLKTFWALVQRVNGRRLRRNQPMVNFYIILDDTGFDERMWNDKTLKAIMMNGRQYGLDAYMCLQYSKDAVARSRGAAYPPRSEGHHHVNARTD